LSARTTIRIDVQVRGNRKSFTSSHNSSKNSKREWDIARSGRIASSLCCSFKRGFRSCIWCLIGINDDLAEQTNELYMLKWRNGGGQHMYDKKKKFLSIDDVQGWWHSVILRILARFRNSENIFVSTISDQW
jgi:hypothetical protein